MKKKNIYLSVWFDNYNPCSTYRTNSFKHCKRCKCILKPPRSDLNLYCYYYYYYYSIIHNSIIIISIIILVK